MKKKNSLSALSLRPILKIFVLFSLFAAFALFPKFASMQSKQNALIDYTISGNVRADGVNLSGATVTLSGAQSNTTTTDTSGNYSFTANAGGNYTVSVYKNGIVYNPASQSFTNLQANQIANFQNGVPLCIPASSGLVGWYRAENNFTDSIGNNNGAQIGNTSFTNGKVGQSFSFDGDGDAVDIGQQTALNGAQEITVVAWIYKIDLANPTSGIVGKWNPGQTNNTFILYNDVGGSTAITRFDVWFTDGTGAGAVGNMNIPTNEWVHVAATWRSSDGLFRIYKNGVLDNASTGGVGKTLNSHSNYTAKIGDWGATTNQNFDFKGRIDETQIYNRALSASEIAAIYNAGSAGVCSVSCVNAPSSNFAAWYKAEDTPVDSSGNGNTGTLSGGATYVAGKVARAFQFNGATAAFTVPNSTSLQPNANSFSVDFWIRAYSFPAGANVAIASKRNESTNSYGWAVLRDGTTGKWRVETRDSFGNFTNAFSTTTAATGTYVHLAFVVDGNGNYLRLYVNGVQEAAQPMATFGSFSSTDPLRIGGNSVVQQYLNGEIDEFRIYNNRYTPSEIQAIVNAGNGVGCQGTATYTPTNANGKIAFYSDRTGNYQIFTMNANGTNQTNVSNNTANDYQPAWSPDGSKITFVSYRNNNEDIYVMNANGSNQIRLTTSLSYDSVPSWSPDGTKIIFYSERTGNGDIYLMNADGSNQTRLTTSSIFDYSPKFSPDGSRIVFVNGNPNGIDTEIYIRNTDGSNQIRLTNNSAGDVLPVFSPDGSKIAFYSNRTGNANDEIFVMNADGSNPINLSNNSATDANPAWSPDGTKIVFDTTRNGNGNSEIYAMNADGTNQIRLTNNTTQDYYPAWQSIANSVTVAPASNVSLTFANVSQAGNTIATPLSAAQVPALPNGLSFYGGAPIYDIRTSAQYSGNITVRFNVANVSAASTCNELRMIHFENGNWTTAVNGTPVHNSATQVCALSQTVTSLSPFAVIQLAPLAADVSVSGRVLTANGRGIRNTTVTITDANGATRSTLTGSFGFYNFDNVRAGETYIVRVKSKSFSFDQPVKVISAQENVGELDFIANESR